MKKLVSFVLSLVMVFFCFSIGVSAEVINYNKYKGFVYKDYDAKDGCVIITNYKGNKTKVTIPTEIKGKKVESITGYGDIKSLHIPDGVTVMYIAKAKKLKTITVNETNNKYAVKNNLLFNKKKTVLYGCPRGNTNPEIPESVKVIGTHAFYGAKFKEVKLPEKLKRIESYAFSHCKNLTEINFNKGLKKIEGQAFEYCNSLKSVFIPNSVKYLGSYAFRFCKNLENVKLSKKLKTLDNAFNNCEKLKMLKIPKSVNTLTMCALQNCISLEKVYIYNSECKFYYKKGYPIFSSIPNTVAIYGYKDSTAQKYAKKNGNEFVKL